jgi:hypothetical protein
LMARPNWHLRLYSLPFAKRYPHGRRDMALILRRQNALASALFGGREVLLIASHWPGSKASDAIEGDIRRLGLSAAPPRPSWTESVVDYTDEEAKTAYSAGVQRWRVGCLDGVLPKIAEYEWGLLAIMSVDTGDAMCPYDGGVDLFVEDDARRSALADRFSTWRVYGQKAIRAPVRLGAWHRRRRRLDRQASRPGQSKTR